MYNPSSGQGEFVELTNFGPAVVNMTGWSFDDDSNAPGSENLAAFGTIQAGESVIFTELSASQFRTIWNLSASVKVVGGVTNNLGRNDQINIYNGNQLIDRLDFGDQNISGSIRTQGVSGHVTNINIIGANNVLGWVLSTNGDIEGSYAATTGAIGSPGKTSFAPVSSVPTPAAAWLMGSAVVSLAGIARRRKMHD